MPQIFTKPAAFRSALLCWYDASKRDLPWRVKAGRAAHAYRVWVSEVMLQQTRVAAVLEYYRRFMKRFPTIKALAAANEAEVLAAWSGLGYYRRARMMHAAARQIVADGGCWPQTSAGLRKLPGIGRYTAAAIASICFAEPVAVVDGNVERVLLRLEPAAEKDLWGAAQQLMDAARPGDFNQAMMELGATVCLPRSPLCTECPVRRWCGTRGEHRVAKPQERDRHEVALALASRRNKVALVQRAKDARLMPGMWELPQCTPNGHAPLLEVRHSITNTDYKVKVYADDAPADGCQWFAAATAATMPLTGLTRKVLRRLGYLS